MTTPKGMDCPVCGHWTKMANRYTDERTGDVIRRRACPECGYRFYSHQSKEVVLEGQAVTFPARNRLIPGKGKFVRVVGEWIQRAA